MLTEIVEPGGIGHAFDLGVARRGAHDAEQRRLPAQAFLDRLRHQAAVGAQRVELVGVGEQADEQVARRAVRRLGAGRAAAAGGTRRSRRRSSRVPSSSAWASTEITSSDGLRAAVGDDRAEVRRTAPATRAIARSRSKPALISSTAWRWNIGRSSRGRPSMRAITSDRERERELADEIGAAAVDERRRCARRRRRGRGRAPTSPSPCG